MPEEMLVIVVDDHEDARAMYALVLAWLGFRVLTAESAEDALILARRYRPQAIVTDVRLPGASGLELTQQLRSDARTRGMAILLLTGDAQACDHREYVDFDRILLKPCLPDTLAREISQTVAARTRLVAAPVRPDARVH
jgi:CheY-like chemotaxis protein